MSPNSLTGPLIGKNVTDLDNIIKNKGAYVTIRTYNQHGEIQGQIVPSDSNISCLISTRPAPPTTSPNPLDTAGTG